MQRSLGCGGVCRSGHTGRLRQADRPPPDLLHRWMPQADAVFLEADGAKRMPCKAPASREPVLLPECDTVLAVAGLLALGRPLREVCFRLDEACALLHTAPDAP